MAGVPGFEPGIAVPKTVALPLGYTPMNVQLLTRGKQKMQAEFFKFLILPALFLPYSSNSDADQKSNLLDNYEKDKRQNLRKHCFN